MARKSQPVWQIYKEQMDFLGRGEALWEPAPADNKHIRIGDVGFIRRGRFHLLFFAGCPLGERSRGVNVPYTFEELAVGKTVSGAPRPPGCLGTGTVRETSTSVAEPTIVLPGHSSNFSFDLTGERGAALVTRYPTYWEDSQLEGAFEKYTRRHYDSWVTFAHEMGCGNIQPVLVSGFDVTKDFCMVAYSNADETPKSDFAMGVSNLGTWHTRSPHTHYGPIRGGSPHEEASHGFPFQQRIDAGNIPNDFNQYVFVRYCTMRRKTWMPMLFKEVFRAGTRQRGSGLGSNRRDTLLPQIASFFQFLGNSEPEIQRYVDKMDKCLGDQTMSDRERLRLFNELCKTCSRHHVIPGSMRLPDCSEGSVEVEDGGYADVSLGTYEGRQVAIKAVRTYVTSDFDVIRSRFCREGVAWKHLRHPNILPLLGVTLNEHRFALVSEWMENGNINDFIQRDPNANRVEFLAGVANGLKYMHNLRVVHGDLKGANILVNKEGRACIADFGLSTIAGATIHAATATASQTSLISNDTLMSFTGGGTRRWMSPELLIPERFGMHGSEAGRPTRQSDCYALGMVIYEVLCGHHPYLEIESDVLAVCAILEGIRPKKPEEAKRLGFSDKLWRMVVLCWLEDRDARPGVEDILSCLNDAAAFWYMREL